MLRKLRLRIRALFRRDDPGDEIASHVEQLTEELMAQGLSPREAKLAAARQFGNVAAIQERSRDLFSFRALGDFFRDLGYAGRILRRTPLFSAGILLVLALGIGANCAIFNLVYTVLLKPLPYGRPQEVVMVLATNPRPAATTGEMVLQWRARSAGAFTDFAVLKMWQGNPEAWFDLVLPDRAERLRAGLVTPNFFSVLGSRAMLGRVFSAADEAAGRGDLLVVSHGLWERAFGSDPDIVGRRLIFVTGRGKKRAPHPYTVVGVLPPEFRFTFPLDTELWAMNSWHDIEAGYRRAIEYNGAVARLAPGVSIEAANARIAGPHTEETRYKPWTTRVETIGDWVSGEARPSLLLMAGVSLLLLVIASATVANALLVRLAERRREIAVRASLGAGRGRILRQLLTEGMVLSLAGAAGGSLLAAALLPAFRALVPVALPRADEMAIRPVLLLFPAAVAMLITMLAMIPPAMQGATVNTAQALKNARGSASAARWRFGFVAVQTAVATSLLIGAALLLVSFWRLYHVDLGFEGNRVLTAEMRLMDTKYFDDAAEARFQDSVLEKVRALPGVRDAGITSAVPFRGVDWMLMIRRFGEEKRYPANGREVTPDYFRIMRIGLLKGRLLTDRDTASSERVLVVSESFARAAFPGEDAIGKQLDLHGPRTIVGIVHDVRYESLDRAPQPAIYIPRAQQPSELVCIVLRAAGDPRTLSPALRRVVHEIDPGVPVMDITTIDRIISTSVADRRFYTTTVAAFALLALLLTASGLVVVIARSVAERRHELAVRSALGAQNGELVRLVVRQGLTPVAFGTAAGLLAAWSGTRILEQFLFNVKLHEPAVYAGAAVFALVIAALACLLPARRIAGMAPSVALQSE
jgi:putative ABC transport system permease protein